MHWQPCRRHVDWSQWSSACRMRQESSSYALIFCWLGPRGWGRPSSCRYYFIFDECTRNALHKKQMRRNCSQWTIIAFAFYLLPRREDANLEYTASQSQSLLQNAVTIIIIVIIRLHGNCCCSSTVLSWLPKPIKSVLDLQFAPTRHANSSCFVFSSIWYPYVAICLSFLINCRECIIGF